MLAPAHARPPSDFPALAKFKSIEKGCGILRDGSGGTRIYNTFEDAMLRLDDLSILPLMVTDKPQGGELLNHKVRTPCIVSLERAGNLWRLRVATRERKPRIEAELLISRDGRLVDVRRNGIYFYVIAEYARENALKNRFDLLRDALSSFLCRAGQSDRDCEYQFLNFAERAFSDELRYQSFIPSPRRVADHQRLSNEVASQVNDPLIAAFHRLIVANESATISPFQIWDAALADSGLSFGPHQWDIGINPFAQSLFQRLVRGQLRRPERLFKPVRSFTARELNRMLNAVPEIDRILSQPRSRRLIVDAYLAWLANEAVAVSRSALPFLDPSIGEDRIMLLFYADVDNQYGSDAIKRELRALMLGLAQRYAGPLEIRATLDAHMLRTPFALSHPDQARARLERTWSILAGF
jgi:hypothetical protein